MDNEIELYYLVCLIHRDTVNYLLWFTGEIDGILVDKSGTAIVRNSLSAIKEFAVQNAINLSDSLPSISLLDGIAEWTENPTRANIDCSDFLNVWNMLDDILKSVAQSDFVPVANNSENAVYDKLFHGCNLPAINTSGQLYTPQWTDEEIGVLAKVFTYRFEMLDKYHVLQKEGWRCLT